MFNRVRSVFLCLMTLMLALTAAGQDKPAPVGRAKEIERETVGKKTEEPQIKVFSPYPYLKARVYNYAGGIRSQFRHMIGLYRNDEWTLPIKITLYGSGNEVHSGQDVLLLPLEISEGNRFQLAMAVKIHDRFQIENFRQEFIRLLIIEQMSDGLAKDREAPLPPQIVPPEWLVLGFDHALKHRALGKPSYFYSGYLKNGQLLRVRDLIRPGAAVGLAPVSKELFQASSAVLIGALCEQKNGGESMRTFLTDLARDSSADPEVLMRKNFPALRETGQGIDKWWALQLANLAQQQSFEYFSPEETETLLQEATKVYFPAEQSEAPSVSVKPAGSQKSGRVLLDKLRGGGASGKDNGIAKRPEFRGTIADFRQFIERPDASEVVASRQRSLSLLQIRAFPLYLPVIARYESICQRIIDKKLAGLEDELKTAAAMREAIGHSLVQAKDYLNYYEATHAPKRSKAFDNYFAIKEELGKQSGPRRGDPISLYMDEAERRFFASETLPVQD